jgi:phosphatidate cytidylyltransferase
VGSPDEAPSRRHHPTRAEFDAAVHELEGQLRETNERINARTGRPLLLAILVGIALGGALLTSLIFIKGLFMLFAAVLIVLASFEFATALRAADRKVPRIPLIITAIAIVPASFYSLAPESGLTREAGHLIVAVAGIVLVSLALPSKRATPALLVRDLGAGAFVVLYVMFLGSFYVLLTAHEGGEWWTLAALIVVASVDTGAYATGLSFGKHPMAPNISPKKTWEGFAGSVAAAVLAGVLLALFMLGQPWWVGVILGLTIVLTATMGDLTESLIKRDLGTKDMSSWLPGHGGILDRIDSALPSGAAAYALFIIFGAGV